MRINVKTVEEIKITINRLKLKLKIPLNNLNILVIWIDFSICGRLYSICVEPPSRRAVYLDDHAS